MKRAILFLALLTAVIALGQNQPTTAIKIDQVGYLTSAPKIAFVAADAQKFTVKRLNDNAVVFTAKLTASRLDPDTGDTIRAADLSQLRTPGKYYLEVARVGRSWPFAIGDDIFNQPYYLSMRAFYGQRCGTAVDLGPEFPTYKHPACHLHGEFDPSAGKKGRHDNVGGWHDAGDYGRYIPNSNISVATLLWAWDLYGQKLQRIRLDIPESGNGTPDLLNEARWNLQWMLEMQDDDGGVWQKQTSAQFPGFIMPEADLATSLVIGTGANPYKSTCATAGLAAVAARASRAYKPFDAAFAATNLESARKAWKWAQANPNVTFKNPVGIGTGEYGDDDCADERLWASAELWLTTSEPEFGRYFVDHYRQHLRSIDDPAAEGWRETASFGMFAYALSDRSDPRVAGEIRDRILQSAAKIAERTRNNAYRVSMTSKDYVWGSNAVAANYSMQLLIAQKIQPNPIFEETAADNLHYLLGRNTFSLSWVTQLGANPYRHPHHRPSEADQNAEPWPGLLSGGPNANRQDVVLKALPQLPPAKVYRDDRDSYSGNEVAINWQAMLVFLLGSQVK